MLERMFSIFFNDWENLLTIAFIMVSALIVFLGAMKPVLFNKIKNKNLRGTALFFSSVLLSFGATALAFWIKDWNFDYYLWASFAFSVWTIFVYSLYEYTRLRSFIEWVGSLTIKKFLGIIGKGEVEEVKEELNVALNELTKTTKSKAKSVEVKADKELKGL